MRRRVIPLLAFFILTLSGCGVWLTHGPPVGHEQMDHFTCSESNTGPIFDIVIGSLNLVGTIAIAGDPEAYGYAADASGAIVATGVVEALILGVSAGVGFDKVKKCRVAQQQLADRLAARARSAAPVAPPGSEIVDSVRVDPASTVLGVSQTVQLAALAFGPGGVVVPPPAFRWSSSNDAIASVSNTGLVTARAQGTVVIAANANNVVGIARISVTPP